MWKDADGNIVPKRPNLTTQQQQRAQTEESSNFSHSNNVHNGAPISPPISTSNSFGRPRTDDQDVAFPGGNLWTFNHLNNLHSLPPSDIYQTEEHFWSSNPTPPIIQGRTEDSPYDDPFNPDTGKALFSVTVYSATYPCNCETSSPNFCDGWLEAEELMIDTWGTSGMP